MSLNDWRKQERRPGGATDPAKTTARAAGYYANERRNADTPVATSGEGGIVDQAERVGLQGTAQRWASGREQLALAGTATGESSATIARKMGKYESLISGGTGGGGTRISAQSFSAGSQRWAGRVGTDRSAPNSFGNPAGLWSSWVNGGLNGAGSLNNRWDSNGNLNSSAQQQTMFEETQKRSAVAATAAPEAPGALSNSFSAAVPGASLSSKLGVGDAARNFGVKNALYSYGVLDLMGAVSPLFSAGKSSTEALDLEEKLRVEQENYYRLASPGGLQ